MHFRLLLQMFTLASSVMMSSNAVAKDEAKFPLPPNLEKRCEDKLQFAPFQPQWKSLLPGLTNPAVIYSYGSQMHGYQLLNPEMTREAAEQGLAIDFDSEHGDVTLSYIDRKDSRVAPQIKARIPLKEPFSKIEYFPAGNTSGFIAIVGWTRVHYYEYRGGKIIECDERELHDFNPVWEVELYPLPFTAAREGHDEVVLTDSRGQKLYLSRKQAKLLADRMGVATLELTLNHPIAVTMKDPRFPGQHSVEFFEAWNKAHQAPIPRLTDIFTRAAMDLSRLQNPDFSEFFGPMVDLAFSYQFRNAQSGQHFVNELTKVIAQISKGTVRPAPGFHAIPGDREIAQFLDPSGAKYLLRYQPFSSSPLKLEKLP